MQRQPLSYRLERITSKDGSTLTYRQLGEGPVSFLLMGGDKSPPYLRLPSTNGSGPAARAAH